MDPIRFDAVTRSLTIAGSRRTVLALLTGGALTLLGLGGATAHNPLRACRRIENRQRRRRCERAARAHNQLHALCQGKADGTDCGNGRRCSGGLCATPPTCNGRFTPTDESCSGCCASECPGGECFISKEGEPCHDDFDCLPPTTTCVGYVCKTSA